MPESVIVTYYDTREGSSVVGTQTYSYGDVLDLLEGMEDTNGYTFAGWSSNDGLKLVEPNVTRHAGESTNYWTLDITASWAQKTTDYTTTITWDDYGDNDGARPRSVRVGLVSSNANNSVIETKTLSYDGNDTQSVTFKNLPITTSDSSTEKIQYSSVLLSYSDVGGNTFDIQDTASTNGTLTMSTCILCRLKRRTVTAPFIPPFPQQFPKTIPCWSH